MAASVPTETFNATSKLLYSIASEERPEDLDENSFAAAVLEHGKSISRGNFIWFKVKPVSTHLSDSSANGTRSNSSRHTRWLN
jgi:hypothetical protein